MKRENIIEILETDVLVIGGGGAGLQAAIAAREKGARVLLVSKTPIGKSTCTQLSGGGFSLAVEGFSASEHTDATLLAGKGLNERNFVQALIEEAPERIRGLERLGLVGEWGKGHFMTHGKPPSWGAPIVKVLSETAQKNGIGLLPWVTIYDLVKEGETIAGAMGFNFRTGKTLGFAAKAVILANGGGGALYARNDNPLRTTGDGYLLAYNAGCTLRDMEFVQFLPQALAEPGKASHLMAPSLVDAGEVINSRGENFLEKYKIFDRPVAIRCRDLFSQAIVREEGEGGEVFVDLRALKKETWPGNNMARSQRDMLMGYFRAGEKPLRISPTCHFFMGGVSTDLNGKTGIPGLFATGEVIGGVHGANRMGGNALSEIFVFGYRAGNAAADWLKEDQWARNAGKEILKKNTQITESRKGAGRAKPKDLRKKIGRILWNKAGILRNKEGLQSALKMIEAMRREELLNASVETPKEVLEKGEVESALLVGEMISRSALLREESRGAHYREDFPKTDDQKWKGNVFLKNSPGGMSLRFKPVLE